MNTERIEQIDKLRQESEKCEKAAQRQLRRQSNINTEITRLLSDEAFESDILKTVSWSLVIPDAVQHVSFLTIESRVTPEIARLFPGGWYHDYLKYGTLELTASDNDLYLRGPAPALTAFIKSRGLKVHIDDLQRQIDKCDSMLSALLRLRDLVK